MIYVHLCFLENIIDRELCGVLPLAAIPCVLGPAGVL